MAIAHLLQTDTANSTIVIDTLFDTNTVVTSVSLQDDLNIIRSLLKKLIGNLTWTDLSNTLNIVTLSTLISRYDNKIIKLEDDVKYLKVKDFSYEQNFLMIDLKDLNFYDTAGNQVNSFEPILREIVNKLFDKNYSVNTIFIAFPIEKINTIELDKLVSFIKSFKEFVFQNKLPNINFGIYVNLHKVIPNTLFNALSTLSSSFTVRLPSFFSEQHAAYIDYFLLGPIDDIQYYTYNSSTSTYTYTDITTLGDVTYIDFVDSVFYESLRHLELRNTKVIFSVRNVSFFYKNMDRILSLSSGRNIMIPSTFLYAMNNIDYHYNLYRKDLNIFIFDSLVDPSDCPGTYTTPYSESQLCAFRDSVSYNNLGTHIIDGSLDGDLLPNNFFIYISNSIKLKNKRKIHTLGLKHITNISTDYNFYKSSTFRFSMDSTNSTVTYSLELNNQKRLQIEEFENGYKEIIKVKELDDSKSLNLHNSSIEIQPNSEFVRDFVVYSKKEYTTTIATPIIYFGIYFTEGFTLNIKNKGFFSNESTYKNVVSLQFSPTSSTVGNIVLSSQTNSLTITGVPVGYHVFSFYFNSSGQLEFDIDFDIEEFDFLLPYILDLHPSAFIEDNTYYLRILNNSSSTTMRVSNIIYKDFKIEDENSNV